jgi:hypothetical protein
MIGDGAAPGAPAKSILPGEVLLVGGARDMRFKTDALDFQGQALAGVVTAISPKSDGRGVKHNAHCHHRRA